MKKLISIAFLFLSLGSIAQNTAHLVAPWKLYYYDGQVSLMGNYRYQSWLSSTNNFYNTKNSNALSGEVVLNTKSYVWHPNFLLLDVGFAFSPGRFQDNFLETMDLFTVSTTKRLNVNAIIFNSKPVTFTSKFNLNETYQKRENITDVKTTSNNIGAGVLLKNKYFPLQLSYEDNKIEQTEIGIKRSYKDQSKALEAKVSRSFFGFDKNDVRYLHDEHNYEYISGNQDYLNAQQLFSIDNLNIQNQFSFDSPVPTMLNSSIDYYDRKGFLNYNRFQVIENASIDLPYHLKNKSSYQYIDMTQSSQNTKTHIATTALSHQLFLSLNSGINYTYTNQKQTIRHETSHTPGLFLNYIKKIPTKGILTMNYNYSKQITNMASESNSIVVINEEHTLSNAVIKLLDKPYAELNTVLVTDVTETIVYQLNFDYTLVQNGNFIEIRRIPGGLIAEGGTVLIDYQAIQPGNYDYHLNQQSFSFNISLFDRMLNLYYKRNQQGYSQVNFDEFMPMNFYTSNIVGASIEKHFGEAGIEYTDYQSSIIPYTMKRYYTNIHYQYHKNTLVSLNGNFQDYTYSNLNRKQKFIDITGKVAYNFKQESKLSLDIGFRNEQGDIQQLNMITSRLEYTGVFYNLYLTAGVEFYKRYYLKEEFILNGIYLRIVRKFSK